VTGTTLPWWPWWLCGLALAAVPLLHWAGLRRSLAVSGRFSALVNRLRHGAPHTGALSEQEMLAAIRAATADQFGAEALEAPDPAEPSEPARPARGPEGPLRHLLFLVGLGLGGLLSAMLGGMTPVGFTLASEGFQASFGAGGPLPLLVLLVGGVLVGFGTRMAGGCTSGHGLCGVSQFQVGSLAATCAFFGMGIATSFLLEVWL
jgi:hypothetical protein